MNIQHNMSFGMGMPHELISDRLAEDFAWVGDVAAFLESPLFIALVTGAAVVASLCVTRSARRTLTAVALIATSTVLIYLLGQVASPLALILTPLAALGIIQGVHWGASRGDRLQWIWEDDLAKAREHLFGGAVIATVGLVIVWGTLALTVAYRGPEDMYPGVTPGITDWLVVLLGMGALFAGGGMTVVGAASMFRGLRLLAAAATNSTAVDVQQTRSA